MLHFLVFSTLKDCSENLTDFPCESKFVIPRSVVSNSLEPTFCFSRWCFFNAADILDTLGSTVNTCSCVSLRRLFVQSLMFVHRKFNGIDHVLFETLSLLETMLKGHEDRVLKASQLLIALGSQGVFCSGGMKSTCLCGDASRSVLLQQDEMNRFVWSSVRMCFTYR